MLLVENSVSGVEAKTVYEGESSTAPVTSAEKWSQEAIVARANARPERMQKLKVATNSGENPGFDFLQECWNDDPALQIVMPLFRELKQRQLTPVGRAKLRERVAVEHSLSHIGHWQGDQARYVGSR
nr:hypothetical protein [Nostoc sp. ChiQUE02]